MPELPPPYWESPLDRPKLAAVGVGRDLGFRDAAVVVQQADRQAGRRLAGHRHRHAGGDDGGGRRRDLGRAYRLRAAVAAAAAQEGQQDDEGKADADGNWSVGAPTGLKDGAHRLVVAVEDALGQTAASTPFTLTIASATPTPTAMPTVPTFKLAGADVPFIDLTDPASVVWPVLDGALSAGNMPTLVGSAAPGADIRFWEGRTPVGATQSDANGRWSFPLPDLSAGTHRLKVEVTGGPNNKSESAEWVVTVEGGTSAGTASNTPVATGTPGTPTVGATATR